MNKFLTFIDNCFSKIVPERKIRGNVVWVSLWEGRKRNHNIHVIQTISTLSFLIYVFHLWLDRQFNVQHYSYFVVYRLFLISWSLIMLLFSVVCPDKYNYLYISFLAFFYGASMLQTLSMQWEPRVPLIFSVNFWNF